MEQCKIINGDDTIAAISTPSGVGGIAVVRVSGAKALQTVDMAWRGKKLSSVSSHTVHLGKYVTTDGAMLDECVATVFRAPSSFTGEDVVEISVHGSRWIQRELLADLIRRGARTAEAGEFTQRAFINGKLDLAQAEGVADLIASSSRAAHRMALSQTRGGFSKELENLREKLVEFASLLELELDFSEEDVEFADRTRLLDLGTQIIQKIDRLSASYSAGAVLKNGVPVAIAGTPNAGKSSLLNLLLSDDKAIVSDIPGTTRDIIEDTVEINGILYRFIDTAGLRTTSDKVESLGIDRARARIANAHIAIWVIDPLSPIPPQIAELNKFVSQENGTQIIVLFNKSDISFLSNPMSDAIDISAISRHDGIEPDPQYSGRQQIHSQNKECHNGQLPQCDTGTQMRNLLSRAIPFSTLTGDGLSELTERLEKIATEGYDPEADLIVTNSRHYESLLMARAPLLRALEGINNGLSADFISQDIREATHHLASITGAITTDTLLHSIFSTFCIGK